MRFMVITKATADTESGRPAGSPTASGTKRWRGTSRMAASTRGSSMPRAATRSSTMRSLASSAGSGAGAFRGVGEGTRSEYSKGDSRRRRSSPWGLREPVSGLSPVSIPVSHDARADKVTSCVSCETGSPLPGASLPALAPWKANFGQTLVGMTGGGAHPCARQFEARADPVRGGLGEASPR